MKKIVLKNTLSLISLVTLIFLLVSVLKINILSNKYLILFIMIEVVINLLGIILINLKKKVFLILGFILLLIISVVNAFGFYYLDKTNTFIDNGFSDYVVVNTDYLVITNTNNPINDIKDVNNKIYYYKYSKSIDLALKKLNKYRFESTDSISSVLNIINNDSNNYLLISRSNYDYLMSSTILYDRNNYKIIKEFSVSYKELKNNTVKDSYTIYLNGVDFTGVMRDFNMLVTVNTKSRQIVLTSILRGYYIDVPAYNIKDTLMCLGSLDSDVSKEALEKLFDVDIDYTFNVNTNSLVNIVDTLGGVEFCSDYDFTTTHVLTTDTYNDKNGTKLRVTKGCKNYNGKEILAISRERLNLRDNERGRINNCRKILLSIGKKTLNTSTLSNYSEILNSYSNLYTTDMNKKTVTNLFKSLIENYSDYEIIEQYPDGSDGKGMGHLGTQEVGVTIPDMNQVNTASAKIKEVLKNK
ncbi:MAG: LCP family protein [bacterium]|nr:LCP family protein [bacterium]